FSVSASGSMSDAAASAQLRSSSVKKKAVAGGCVCVLSETAASAPSPGPPSPEEIPTPTLNPPLSILNTPEADGLERCSSDSCTVLAPGLSGSGMVLTPGFLLSLGAAGSCEGGSLTWQCWCFSKVRIWI